MKNKSIYLIIAFALLFIMNAAKAEEQRSWRGYLGLGQSSSQIEVLGKDVTIAGFELGADYQWLEFSDYKSASRFGIKSIQAGAGNDFLEYKISMSILVIGQDISRDFQVGENTLTPYANIELGMAFTQAEFEFLGETEESDIESSLYYSLNLGLRYKIDKWVPYLSLGHQVAKVDDVEVSSGSGTQGGEVDFGGTYITLGLGVVF